MGLTYTNIQHEFRKNNELSCNEYVLLDMIYFLQTSPLSKIQGWCYMKRDTMADEIGISKQGILKMIDRLIISNFIERDEETKYLRTTRKWNLVYFNSGKQSVPTVNKVTESSKQSSPETSENNPTYNSTIEDNNKDNIKRKRFISPTINDIEIYVSDKYNASQLAASNFADKFFNHYQSKGWKVGSSKMEDWNAAINGVWKKTAEEFCLLYPKTTIDQAKRRTLNDKYE